MIGKAGTRHGGEHTVGQDVGPGVGEIVGNVRFEELRVGIEVAIDIPTDDLVELVHVAAIDGNDGIAPGVSEIERTQIRGMSEGNGLPGGDFARGSTVSTGKG